MLRRCAREAQLSGVMVRQLELRAPFGKSPAPGFFYMRRDWLLAYGSGSLVVRSAGEVFGRWLYRRMVSQGAHGAISARAERAALS